MSRSALPVRPFLRRALFDEAAFHACKDISWAMAQLYTKEVLPWAI